MRSFQVCILVCACSSGDPSSRGTRVRDAAPGDSSDSAIVDAPFADRATASDSAPDVDAGSATDTGPDSVTDAGTITRVRVHYDPGSGNRITLRGGGGDLSWTTGKNCDFNPGNIWICSVVGRSVPFEFKPYLNDSVAAKGTNWQTSVGATIDLYPYFNSAGGRLVAPASVSSAFLTSGSRNAVVYLPPSYDENLAKSYPIVLMQDGQNLFDPAAAFGGVAWEVDAAMDRLADSHGIFEAIVVGVDNSVDRIREYTPTVDPGVGQGGGADAYLDFLATELVPYLRARYRTAGTRVGLAGSSLGGLLTLYGCWTRPQAFDRCGVFSPSLYWDGKYLLNRINGDPATASEKPLTIYLDSGDSGPSFDGFADTASMRDVLVGKGFVLGQKLMYVLGSGQTHSEAAWATRTPGAFEFLLDDPDRVP